MKSRLFRSAGAAAVAVLVCAAPAHAAAPVPDGPVRMYLKDHDDLPLGQDDAGVRLTADHDLWRLEQVETAEEALVPLGEYRIVHVPTGECLAADTSGGGETAPVSLGECEGAGAWAVVFDDAPSHADFRFITADGYYLGLEADRDAVEGAQVLAVKPASGASRHFHEWQFAAAPPETPTPTPSPSPSSPGSSSEAPSSPPVSQPRLPTTGAGLGMAVGAGAVALAGGTALVLWWQRRRALRHW